MKLFEIMITILILSAGGSILYCGINYEAVTAVLIGILILAIGLFRSLKLMF
jgi:hypothetical protein